MGTRSVVRVSIGTASRGVVRHTRPLAAHPRRRRLVTLAAIGAAAAALPGIRSLAAVTTWVGGTGSWTDSSKWTNGVPNGTDVLIDGGNPINSVVTLASVPFGFSNLTVDAGDTLITSLNLGGYTNFGLNGNAIVNGQVSLDGSWLSLANTNTGDGTTLSGTGLISLSANGGAVGVGGFQINNPATIASGIVISGPTLYMNGPKLTTSAAIHANTLTLDRATNLGSIDAFNSGSANFLVTNVSNGPGGSINATGQFNGSNFVNAGGLIQLNNGAYALFNNSAGTASLNGTFTVNHFTNAAGATFNMNGGLLTAQGVWQNDGTFNFNAGELRLRDSYTNGNFPAQFIAHGAGTLLDLNANGALDNTGSTYNLASGHDFSISGNAVVRGGTFTSTGGFLTINYALLDGVTLNTGSNTAMGPLTVTIVNGLVVQNTSINASGATLQFGLFGGAGSRSLTGTGEFYAPLNGSNTASMAFVSDSTATATIGPGILIHGGSIGTYDLTNQGTMRVEAPGASLSAANFNNTGFVRIASGATLLLQGPMTNTGTLQLDPGATVRLTTALGSQINAPGGLAIPAGVTLTGTAGVVNANVNLAGTIDPDNPGTSTHMGTIRVNGNLTFASGAHYISHLGFGTNNADQIQVTGNLDLSAGNVFLDLSNDQGGTYTVATYTGTLTGAFDNVTPGYIVTYAVPGQIEVIATPEPGALALASIGAGAMLLKRRRRGKLGATNGSALIPSP